MPKTYVILHDGTKVLICQGGHSGKKPRQGYHLPGGGMNPKETALQTAQRELKEETGLDVGITSKDTFTLNSRSDVTIVVQKVTSVSDLVSSFNRHKPEIKDENDEPFSSVMDLPIAECLKDENFPSEYETEWFGEGLRLAHGRNLLK